MFRGVHVKVGIIGCGAIAARAYVPGFRRAGAEIVAVADMDFARAKSFSSQHVIPKSFADHEKLLDLDIELVTICTPPETHASIALDCANKGKHILVEKPMATSLEDAQRMVHACEVNAVKLCVMHQYRFIPCVQDAKRRLSGGRLGEVLCAEMIAHPQFPLRWSDSKWLYEKWSLLDDYGVHMLDVVSFLADSPAKRVWVVPRDTTGKLGFFDAIEIMLELANSWVVYLDLSWVVGTYQITASLFGTAGKIDMDIRNNHLSETHGYVTPFDEIGSTLRKSWGEMSAVLTRKYFTGALVYHDIVIRSFLQALSTDGEPPVGPQDGLKIIDFLDKIKRAAP